VLDNNRLDRGPTTARPGKRGRVRELSLRENKLAAERVTALLSWPGLAWLERLDLSQNRIGQDPGALAGWGGLRGLDSLRLANNRFGPEGFAVLAASLDLPWLRELWLDENKVALEGAQALAGCAALASVRHLSVRRCQLGDSGLGALASAAHLTQLHSLDANCNRVGRSGVQAVVDGLPGRWRRSSWRRCRGAPPTRRGCCAPSPSIPRTT
jgi:hypothetical protein